MSKLFSTVTLLVAYWVHFHFEYTSADSPTFKQAESPSKSRNPTWEKQQVTFKREACFVLMASCIILQFKKDEAMYCKKNQQLRTLIWFFGCSLWCGTPQWLWNPGGYFFGPQRADAAQELLGQKVPCSPLFEALPEVGRVSPPWGIVVDLITLDLGSGINFFIGKIRSQTPTKLAGP